VRLAFKENCARKSTENQFQYTVHNFLGCDIMQSGRPVPMC